LTFFHAGSSARAAGHPRGLHQIREGLPTWYYLCGCTEETPHKTVLHGQKREGQCDDIVMRGVLSGLSSLIKAQNHVVSMYFINLYIYMHLTVTFEVERHVLYSLKL